MASYSGERTAVARFVAMSETPTSERPEELEIFVERLLHFFNLWTIYEDLKTGKYVPSVGTLLHADHAGDARDSPIDTTVMFVLYSYFYSLVEDSNESLNGFRVWRSVWPKEEAVISAVEARVLPFVAGLKLFRNRLGFHGSRTRDHEAAGLDFFIEHSGTEVYKAMRLFRSLGVGLLGMDTAVRENDLEKRAQRRSYIDGVAARAKDVNAAGP
jgi:hypothetical protein